MLRWLFGVLALLGSVVTAAVTFEKWVYGSLVIEEKVIFIIIIILMFALGIEEFRNNNHWRL